MDAALERLRVAQRECRRRVEPRILNNTDCVSCGKLEKEMVGVGEVDFCTACFLESGLSTEGFDRLDPCYRRWVEVSLSQ